MRLGQALSGLERFLKDETPVQVLDVRTDSGRVFRNGRIRKARAAAAPDPDRKKPYHFKGFTGQTVIKPGLS